MTVEPDAPSRVGAQLAHAERTLAVGGSPSARQDAIELLSALLGESPALLLAHPEAAIAPAAVRTYAEWIARRGAGDAVPHITGHLAFMDLDLMVGRGTPLVPPYAARLVETALACVRRSPDAVLVAELGTGCGAIALALAALEPRCLRIYAVDPSPEALRTAVANGVRYLLNLVITWRDGGGLDAVPEPVDLLIRAACGHAGAPEFTELARRAPAVLRPGGTLVCGLDPGQEAAAVRVLRHALPMAEVWADPRSDGVVVVAQLPRASEGGAAFETGR